MRTDLNCASCIINDLCGALQLVPLEKKIKKEILIEQKRVILSLLFKQLYLLTIFQKTKISLL